MFYTKEAMKITSKSKQKAPHKKQVFAKKSGSLAVRVSSKKSSVSLVKKMKRYSKQTLRSVLLSHTFHTSFKVVVGLIISSGLLYGSYLAIGTSFANEVVISKGEIVTRVGKLTSLPKEDPYDIVRVQDSEYLKKQNSFYKDIEEGDYILMYPHLAVIYNLRNNQIVAIKQGIRDDEGQR